MSFPFLFAISVALVVTAAMLAITAAISGRAHGRVAERLDMNDPGNVQTTAVWWRRLAEGGRGMEQWFQDDVGIDMLLVRAGWRGVGARTPFYVAQIGLPFLALLIAATALYGRFTVTTLLVGVMAVIISLLLPRWVLRGAVRRRQLRIRAEVTLFINLMVLLLEAGLSTRQALQTLVRDSADVLPELGREFRLALRQMDAGGDLGDVLTSMGKVLDVSELTGILGVLRQVERFGGEIREPLRAALVVLEERRELLIQERVNALAAYMTWVMVLFFFPFMFVCVAGPAVASIFRAIAHASS